MRMGGDPFLHLDAKPKSVNSKGDDGQDKPNDVFAKELNSFAIKFQAIPIDDCVLDFPILSKTSCPRVGDTKSEGGHQETQQVISDELDKASIEGRFAFRKIFVPFDMGMRSSPFLHLDGKPEGEDPKGNDTKKGPQDEFSE